MNGMRRTGPIKVEKTTNWKHQPAWAWHCDTHPRARGFHNQHRWTDHYRRVNGYDPDAHPWQRCMDGAARHWHKYHSQCICAVTHRPLVSHEARPETA